jgi:hypothetical protein
VHTLHNELIAQLEEADQVSLLVNSERVELDVGTLLDKEEPVSSSIYFPVSCVITQFVHKPGSTMDEGLAVGLIGREGASGLQAALGMGSGNFQSIVQSSGSAIVVKSGIAQRLAKKNNKVLLLFSKYMWKTFNENTLFAAMAHTQEIKTRLAHWLLLSAQRSEPSPLRLTHTQIAKSLGVRRTSISIAAREMKLKRYVSYSRGEIRLLNVHALESMANVHRKNQ